MISPRPTTRCVNTHHDMPRLSGGSGQRKKGSLGQTESQRNQPLSALQSRKYFPPQIKGAKTIVFHLCFRSIHFQELPHPATAYLCVCVCVCVCLQHAFPVKVQTVGPQVTYCFETRWSNIWQDGIWSWPRPHRQQQDWDPHWQTVSYYMETLTIGEEKGARVGWWRVRWEQQWCGLHTHL